MNKLKKNIIFLAFTSAATSTLTGCDTTQQFLTESNDWDDSCSVNMDLRQSGRISLDLTRYGKDSFNQTQFDMPTSCNELKHLSAGKQIVDEFRWGSFITEGSSSSSWDMSVKHTNPIPKKPDMSECTLGLTLRERHTGISPLVFLKDKWNAQQFDWKVPCDVHDKVNIGHNFVTDPWRKGSMAKRILTKDTGVAIGIWSVEVTEKKGSTSKVPSSGPVPTN